MADNGIFKDGDGGLRLTGFILLVIAGVLALVAAVERFGIDRFLVDATAALVLAAVALAAAYMAWQRRLEPAGVLGVAAGAGFLMLFPETAGVLALIGGVLLLVSGRMPAQVPTGDGTSRPKETDASARRQTSSQAPGAQGSPGGSPAMETKRSA